MRYSQKYLEEKFTEDELSEMHEGVISAIGKGVGSLIGKGIGLLGKGVEMGMTPTRPTHASPGNPDPYPARAMRGKEIIKSKLGLGGEKSPKQPKIKQPRQITNQDPKRLTDTTPDITPDRDPETYSATEKAFRKNREKIKFRKTK